ncbi:MAG: hypothetical protein R3B54_00115 [Bdellovibrionota bacterium]
MHPILDALENKEHVIWDWNGTLLDDVHLCVGVISELLVEQGKAALSGGVPQQIWVSRCRLLRPGFPA